MPDDAAQTDPMATDLVPRDRQFVHLHLHSEYSLLDGGNRVDKLVARVKELGMPAVAVTDHGNMHAAISFYEQARAAGIKPIMGVEAYVAQGDRRSREYTGVADGGHHLVLLAENETGWKNLLYLCSEAYLTGFYFKPRMDREILETHADGLIAINGHLGSELAFHLTSYERTKDESHWNEAIKVATWHNEVFKPNEKGEPRFYVELQHHVGDQNAINPHLIRLAKELDLPLVCDNDSHFLRADDHDAHDTLICISMGKVKNDESRLRYTPELYVKSPQQMRELFEGTYSDVGKEALDNTVRIAERCNVELPIGANHAPSVRIEIPKKKDLPAHSSKQFAGDLTAWYKAYCASFELQPFDAANDDSDPDTLKADSDKALRMLCEAGMVWRYGPSILDKDAPENIDKWARLERELGILADKLISAYFLIVWDFVNWGRQQGIPALARGSGVGTMVGYVLGLSNACPVNYGLLFERFTDPDRAEYPDIDIDLCQDGRQDVIEYVRQKSGHVAQIITFGTLKARAAVRDVGRVLEYPLAETDKLAKLIPEQLGVTLDKALELEPELKALYEKDATVKRVIDTGRVIEGQARHSSVHAAGVIVATRPLHEIVPLYKQSGAADHEIVTQWDGPTCEKMGLLKMDFLGLRTLSIIERAKELITTTLPGDEIWRAVHGDNWQQAKKNKAPKPLDLDRLDYKDQRVYDTFRRGDTTGVFQFESGGMRRLLTEMKPDRLEDLIAANALFRPGPMDLIPDYNKRKHGEQAVPKVHPIVDKFTAETYGVMVYQEQVMQIVHELGGIPLRAAYTLIKAISKKKAKVIDANRPKFIEGAGQKGLAKKDAEELFELILKFAGYGFNKSHSTGYAIVAYQTAYLKTYFPNQYMAAFLTYESQAQKVSDWTPYLEDCKRTRFTNGKVGVEVRPPDVNLSQASFTVVFDPDEPRDAQHGHVRFGLRAIKGAGEKAINAIIAERDRDATDATAEQAEPYSSLHGFAERIPAGTVNKATIEALIKAGAFDSVHGPEDRAAMAASIDEAVAAGQRLAKDRAMGQEALFGGGGDTSTAPQLEERPLVTTEPWSEKEMLENEKSVLGFYLSSHPLDRWKTWAKTFATSNAELVKDARQDQRVVLPGMISSARIIVIRNGKSAGQKMAILTFEDFTTSIDAVLFSDCYAKFEHLIEEDAVLFVLGRVDHARGKGQVIVERVVPIDGVPVQPGKLWLNIESHRLNGTSIPTLDRLAQLMRETSASLRELPTEERPPLFPVLLNIQTADGRAIIEAGPDVRIAPTPQLLEQIDEMLGEGCVCVTDGTWLESTERKGRGNYNGNGGGGGRGATFSSNKQGGAGCASIDRY